MTSLPRSQSLAGFVILGALLFAVIPNGIAQQKGDGKWEPSKSVHPESVEEMKALQERVKTVVEKCTPCIVAIQIGKDVGSGVIVSEDGLVLTSAQILKEKQIVYEAAQECTIVLSSEKKVRAKSLGLNVETDCGMVKIIEKGPKEGKWPFLPVIKSNELLKGQWVVAMGHPGGPKAGRLPVVRLGRIEDVAEITATSSCILTSGDIGGPLLDLNGNVVGIHTQVGSKLSLNHHIPVENFNKQWDKLAAGEVFGEAAKKPASTPPLVGLVFPENDLDDAWVFEVEEGGPAAKAGLKPGDTITKINGVTVKSVRQFRELIKERMAGEVVKLTVRRGRESHELSLTLGKRGP